MDISAEVMGSVGDEELSFQERSCCLRSDEKNQDQWVCFAAGLHLLKTHPARGERC